MVISTGLLVVWLWCSCAKVEVVIEMRIAERSVFRGGMISLSCVGSDGYFMENTVVWC